LNMDGSDQEMTHHARRFGRQLHGRFALPVHLVDERLSTHEARTRLELAGRGGEDADATAAQIILEDWFSLSSQAEDLRP
ncbi:MAG: Holliday junction resolvase RuvX, partial [Gammaproteobacteria bacterium]|nr:Holliday junction resolvase RuvX [Gammaproteobacteria bacterium]